MEDMDIEEDNWSTGAAGTPINPMTPNPNLAPLSILHCLSGKMKTSQGPNPDKAHGLYNSLHKMQGSS